MLLSQTAALEGTVKCFLPCDMGEATVTSIHHGYAITPLPDSLRIEAVSMFGYLWNFHVHFPKIMEKDEPVHNMSNSVPMQGLPILP